MDKVALRKLIDAGVKRFGSASHTLDVTAEDSTTLVLDRLTQAGELAIAHEEGWLLEEVTRGLREIYKSALPQDWDSIQPDATTAQRLFDIGSRVWILGANMVNSWRLGGFRQLVLQRPIDRWKTTFWMRYTVTMAARGQIDVFRGKSLIGPISEKVREKPQFFAAFNTNLDTAVNAMCQFDFLSCVLVAAETKSIDDVYPNFGGYYSERTSPVIEDLIAGGESRRALGDVSHHLLAEILNELHRTTAQTFFGVNGWHGYSQPVQEFILEHTGKQYDDA